jgi:Fe-Mn family superoxide dismutase
MRFNRRQFMTFAGASLAAAAFSDSLLAREAAELNAGYELPKLPYAFDALMPHIDAETMQIHHDKHHAAYLTNLIKALEAHPDLKKLDPVKLIATPQSLPADIKQTVINNGGGHVNHSMFWQMMKPDGGGAPKGELAGAIDAAFGGFEKFQAAFSDAALKRFGSGWAWLVAAADKKLSVISTANQDSPLMNGQTPILGVDVWEHAYYLKYQNRRADYVKAWWNVVNWDDAAARLAAMKA